jgi:hypothetical protein
MFDGFGPARRAKDRLNLFRMILVLLLVSPRSLRQTMKGLSGIWIYRDTCRLVQVRDRMVLYESVI